MNNITYSPGGKVEYNLSYLCLNYIKINSPGDYYFKYPVSSIGANNYKITLCDTNKTPLRNQSATLVSGSGNDTIVKLTITSSDLSGGILYIVYNQSLSKKNDLMFVKDYYPSEYIPYGVNISDLIINPEQIRIDYRTNPIYYSGNEVSIFSKGFFAGDSLTTGTFNHNESGSTQFEVIQKYSYPTYFNKLFGCEVIRWGIGGETTKSWYELTSVDTRTKDYDFAVINLGANDTKINDVSVSKTYYQKIIDMFKADVKNVKIFCCTVTPAYSNTNTTFFNSFNDMIRNIVSSNNNCYLIDLAKYSKCVKGTAYVNGHLTALGYLQQAKEIGNMISYEISKNHDDFKYVQFIGTNYSQS